MAADGIRLRASLSIAPVDRACRSRLSIRLFGDAARARRRWVVSGIR
jgi:hypothetical protein